LCTIDPLIHPKAQINPRSSAVCNQPGTGCVEGADHPPRAAGAGTSTGNGFRSWTGVFAPPAVPGHRGRELARRAGQCQLTWRYYLIW
jgi:hypothetical protein